MLRSVSLLYLLSQWVLQQEDDPVPELIGQLCHASKPLGSKGRAEKQDNKQQLYREVAKNANCKSVVPFSTTIDAYLHHAVAATPHLHTA